MGTPDDAALGLPLVMTGPDSTRRLDAITQQTGGLKHEPVLGSIVQLTTEPQVVIKPHDGTKPGPTTPCRTDAASLSAKPDKYGEVLAREFDAFVRLKATLKTREQEEALSEYEEAIDASRRARNQLKGGPQ